MRSQEEITYLAATWLRRQHGERVAVQFHDLHNPQTQEDFPAVVDSVVEQRLPLPVVQIDGGLTSLPFLSYWAIVDMVERALAEQSQAQ